MADVGDGRMYVHDQLGLKGTVSDYRVKTTETHVEHLKDPAEI